MKLGLTDDINMQHLKHEWKKEKQNKDVSIRFSI